MSKITVSVDAAELKESFNNILEMQKTQNYSGLAAEVERLQIRAQLLEDALREATVWPIKHFVDNLESSKKPKYKTMIKKLKKDLKEGD